VGSTEELTAAMRQFTLWFAPGRAPHTVPPMRGLLSSRRVGDVVQIIVARPGDDTAASIAALNAVKVGHESVSFSDAMVAYLGARGEQRSFLDEAMMDPAGVQS
jgi:hypothetical protein